MPSETYAYTCRYPSVVVYAHRRDTGGTRDQHGAQHTSVTPSQPQVFDAWRHAVEEIVSQTARRLRNFLHQGTLKAYYFADDGRHPVSSDFWATAQANGVLESGTFWPFGGPSRVLERRPNFPLFLVQSELDVLLSEELAEKRQFPQGRRPELAAAYRAREIAMLPNRQAQRRAISELEQFRQYRITDRLFREAERASGPRDLRPQAPTARLTAARIATTIVATIVAQNFDATIANIYG